MMLQIMLERHSDSQIPRNTIGGKQGNAMIVTVSEMILSALECCGLTGRRLGPSSGMLPPLPQLCKSHLWTGSRKLHILQAKCQKNAAYAQGKGWVS